MSHSIPAPVAETPKKILAAMSGGVDSSVVAGLLTEAGHFVMGATLQLYDSGAASGRKGACCAGRDIYDARRAADHLGIPHHVIDREARFREAVIGDFADRYAAGETPIPCVRCNQSVKFTDLLDLAMTLGMDLMATGHYVRRIDGPDGAELHRACDETRDQSWFLFATKQEQLEKLIFPLGDMPDKATVRAEASRLGLAVADKPDSQDLCFVSSGSYADLLAKLRPDAMEKGPILDRDGKVLGEHNGVGNYTVGQAKRLGDAAMVDGERQVVVALDPATRSVTVGPRDTGGARIALREVNWLSKPERRRCTVRLRARDTDRPATIEPMDDGGVSVVLDEHALAAPGQACVFYAGSRVLGGGIIQAAR